MAMPPSRPHGRPKPSFRLDLAGLSERPSPIGPEFFGRLVAPVRAQEPRLRFLDIPAEIRLRVYDILLVSRWERMSGPSSELDWIDGNRYHIRPISYMSSLMPYWVIDPSILRTCRRVYREAISVLYSRNVFNLATPWQAFRFMQQIGPANTALLTSLNISVAKSAELSSWLALLGMLSVRATRLLSLEVEFHGSCSGDAGRGGTRTGLGDNVDFVHVLASLQRLQRISIVGYYGKHWPSYLREKTCAYVQAGCCASLAEVSQGPCRTDDWTVDDLVNVGDEDVKGQFQNYQDETGQLFP